jgi:hypothetical protein
MNVTLPNDLFKRTTDSNNPESVLKDAAASFTNKSYSKVVGKVIPEVVKAKNGDPVAVSKVILQFPTLRYEIEIFRINRKIDNYYPLQYVGFSGEKKMIQSIDSLKSEINSTLNSAEFKNRIQSLYSLIA